MNWSDNDIEKARMAWAASGTANYCPTRAEVEAVLNVAAELLAARGGTMTVLQGIELDRMAKEDSVIDEIRKHILAQGARVVALEKERGEALAAAERERDARDRAWQNATGASTPAGARETIAKFSQFTVKRETTVSLSRCAANLQPDTAAGAVQSLLCSAASGAPECTGLGTLQCDNGHLPPCPLAERP